jgi:hypothetical protein
MITSLGPNEIFVFGSNLRGIHGGGAAAQAHRDFDAAWGCGIGLSGRCYAIPTKGYRLEVLPLPTINNYVQGFLLFAKSKPDWKFMLTPIGTGLAGYNFSDIAPMFKDAPANVIKPDCFL